MEDNLHDDNKLNDYTRQSFDDYEEEPAADMWGRIESDLSPQEGPVLRVAFYTYRWQTAAAAVILLLLSTLVCEHLYYEQRLRALSAHASEAPVFSTENPGEGASFQKKSQAKQAQPAAAQAAAKAGGEQWNALSAKPNSAEGTGLSEPVLGSRLGEPTFRNTDARQRNEGQNEYRNEVSVSRIQAARVGQAGQKISSTALATEDGAVPVGISATLPLAAADSVATGLVSTSETLKQLDLQRIAPRSALLAALVIPPAVPGFLPTKPANRSSGWYLGAHNTWLTTQEKARATVTRPGGRPAFASTQETSDVSSIGWLKVGKNLNPRFTLESGVGYQKTVLTAMHTPRFRFGDGTHVGGPPVGTPRTYNYDLSTYGGTAEVTLRMEQTNPSTQPTNEEPVALKITTIERSELLRIPIVAGYRLGTGRWRGSLKAGLLGNFVLKNELDISTRVSQNARFRPVVGRQGYAVQVSSPEKFSLGYLLSAGAEFKWNRHFSLVAEPLLTGDFTRKDRQGQRLPEHFSVGLNVGANWCF